MVKTVKWPVLMLSLSLLTLPVTCFADNLQSTLTMPDTFTLHYIVHSHNIASSELKKYLVKYISDMHNNAVKGGLEQRSVGDASIAAYRQLIETPRSEFQTSDVVLSCANGKFLYSRNGINVGAGTIVIYNGERSYHIATYKQTQNGDVRRGFITSYLDPLVLPGLGLPNLSIIEPRDPSMHLTLGTTRIDGALPVSGTVSNTEPGYQSGHIDVQTDKFGVKVLDSVVDLDTLGHIEQKWTFSNYQKFSSHWIASRMKFIEYQGMQKNDQLVSEPQTEYDFVLQSASNQAVENRQFEPEAWLKEGCVVRDARNETPVAIIYRIRSGSLDDQLRHMGYLVAKNARAAESGRIRGNILAGVLLAFGMGLGFVAYAYRLRMKSAS